MQKNRQNIYLRRDGRWEGRYKKSDGATGYVYGKTREEVSDKLNDFQDPSAFVQAAERWLFMNKRRWKESTYSKYHRLVFDVDSKIIGRTPLNEITSDFIQKAINEKLENGASASAARDVNLTINYVLKFAGLAEIKTALPKRRKKEVQTLKPLERQRLLKELKNNLGRVELGIIAALYTGLRLGELCALKWSDIDMENGTISVGRTVQRIQDRESGSERRTRLIVDFPKSESSRRRIPIPDDLIGLFKEFQCENEAFFLTGSSEKMMEPRAMQYRFKKYVRACGLENVNFHALRHAFATRCMELGFDVKSLSEILGHSSVATTLNLYVHSSMEQKRTQMNKLRLP